MATQHLAGNIGVSRESSSRGSIVTVVLASFVLGFIPIVWGSMLMASNAEAPTVAGEGTLWSELGR